MDNQTKVKCPNCGSSIDVQDILAHQLEEEIKQKYQSQLADEKRKYESEFESLNKAKEEFEQKKKRRMSYSRNDLRNKLRKKKKRLKKN